jgi:thioesterase domain-containing protein
MAVKVHIQVERQFQKKFPLTAFFQAPTLEQMAKFLTEPSQADAMSPVTVIQSMGKGPPLFLFHFQFMARSVAKHLGSIRPVICIDSNLHEAFQLWQQSGRVGTTLESLASYCLAEVRSMQPHGPYCLGGFCFGGNLAFEVANQLTQQGEQVSLLALLSSYYHWGLKPSSNHLRQRLHHHIRQTLVHRWAYLSMKLGKKLNQRTDNLHSEADTVHNGHHESFDIDENRLLQSDFTRQLLGSYTGNLLAAKTVLFRAVADAPNANWKYDPANGWKDLIQGELLFEDILCGHSEITEDPWIGEVAKKLCHYL